MFTQNVRVSSFVLAGHKFVDRFVQARRAAKEDPDAMAAICQQLLANEDLETAMRAGDCFAALVDYFHDREDWQQCYALIARYSLITARHSSNLL